jgi:hypothetical protein
MVVRTRRRSRSPRDGVGAHHPGRPACGSPAPGGAPSLSSAVIRGTPWRPARVRTAASPRRRAGDRRRTGNGSPVRLPGEILRRLAQDVPARSRAWRSRSPTPLPMPATAPARPPPIRPAPLVVPRSLGRRTTGSTDQGPARAPTPAACPGRFPSPPRSLAASHPESTDKGQQPGGGTPPCSSCGP